MVKIDRLWPLQSASVYNHGAKLHAHHGWELSITLKGNKTHVINDVEYPSPVGSVFLVGPMHTHMIKPVSRSKKENVHLDVYVSDERLRELTKVMFGDDFYKDRCCNSVSPIAFQIPEKLTEELSSNLQRALVTGSPDANHISFKSIAESTIVYLLGLYHEQTFKKDNELPEFIIDFLVKTQSPECYTKRLQDIVSTTGYSYSQFSVLFKKHMQTTLVDYFSAIRINYAAHLLVSSSLSILEIALESGYSSMSSFIDKFRKIYLVTPSEFRRTKQNTNA